MATTPSPPIDHYRLKSFEFQEFCQWVPHAVLQRAGIQRSSFLAVTFILSRHVDFKTGDGSRISQAGMAEESGCSHNTVRKVINFLKLVGVLEVVDMQRRQGRPSENYRLRKTEDIKKVIKNKNLGTKAPSKKAKPSPKVSTETLQTVNQDAQSVNQDAQSVNRDAFNVSVDNDKSFSELSREIPETPPARPLGGGGQGKVADAPRSSFGSLETGFKSRQEQEDDLDAFLRAMDWTGIQ